MNPFFSGYLKGILEFFKADTPINLRICMGKTTGTILIHDINIGI